MGLLSLSSTRLEWMESEIICKQRSMLPLQACTHTPDLVVSSNHVYGLQQVKAAWTMQIPRLHLKTDALSRQQTSFDRLLYNLEKGLLSLIVTHQSACIPKMVA